MGSLRILLVITTILVFYACDPVYHAEIKNKKSKDIIIKVKFDRGALEESWGDKPYTGFLKSYPNWSNIAPAINFDTINLIKTYKIEPNQSFPLSSGIGGHVDLTLIKSLNIINQDTIAIENNGQLEKAFNIKEGRHWIMEID